MNIFSLFGTIEQLSNCILIVIVLLGLSIVVIKLVMDECNYDDFDDYKKRQEYDPYNRNKWK